MPLLKHNIFFFKLIICFVLIIGTFYTSKAQAPPWQWAKGVHSNVAEYATDVAFDPSTGNLVSVGIFNSDLSAFFGSKFIGAVGGGYVAKYDPTGAIIWAFPIGNNQDDACNGVTIDATGNIYVTGYLQQIADFKGMGAVSIILTSVGGKDVFLAKYNPAGQLLWVTQAGGNTDDEGTKVCVTPNGVYITGYYTGQASFGGIGLLVLNTPEKKAYTAAYDVTGNANWATTIGGGSSDALGMDICADNSNVFITGNYIGSSVNVYDAGLLSILSLLFPSATLNNSSASSYDGFTASFTASGGSYNWTSTIHSNSNDYSNGITQTGNNLFITGATSSSANFTGYASNPIATSANGLDLFVAQLSKSSGNANWIKSEPGNNDQQGTSIAIDTTNLITVAGFFDGGINFTGGTSITSSGNEDVFVAAYNLSGSFNWVNQAGDNGTDMASAVATGNLGEVYTVGQYEKNAVFGSTTLIQDSPPNMFIAKIFCPPVVNNLITATQTVCANQTPDTLRGTIPLGGNGSYTYTWQQSADNITWNSALGTNNTQNYTPALLTSNTYYRRIVVATGGCNNTSTSTSVLITINQIPTMAIATPSQTVCASSATITANNPSVGIGTWTGLGVSSIHSNTTTVTGLSVGNNNFLWTISNGVCASSSSTLTIHVDAFPTPANAGTNQSLCAAITTTLLANNPAVGSGVWSVVTGTANITSPTSNATSITGLNFGQTIFMWTISNGTCPSSTSTVSVHVDNLPSAALTASNQTLCASTTTISANNPIVGNGVWSVTTGTSSVISPTTNSTSVTGLSIGQNNFVWTISNGVCPSSSNTITVQVDANPSTAVVSINQVICADTATISANNPSIGNGVWSVITGTSSVTSPMTNTTSVTGLSIGQNNFVWTVSNGVCPSSSNTITIQVDANPSTAVVGANQVICASTTTISANTPSIGNGVWNVITGTSSVSSPTTNATSATGLSIGQNNFVWTISNGVCPSSSNTITVQVDQNPSTATTASNQTVCANNAVVTANNPIIGTGIWTLLAGTQTILFPSTNTTTVANLSVGQNSFVWTISNGVCPSSSDTTIVQVDANPSTATVSANQIICASTTTISANSPSIGNGTWNVITGTSSVTSPTTNTTSVTNLNVGQNNFVWTISNGVCPSSSDTINVQVDANPSTAVVGVNQIICADTTTISANNPSIGNGIWNVLTGTSTVTSPTTNITSINGLNIGQNSFVWTVSNGVCPASSSTITVQVDANPSIATVSANQIICSSTTTISANNPSIGNGVWSVVTGASTVTSPTINATSVTGLSIGQNNFVWTVSNGVCSSSSDTITVQVDANPSTAVVNANQIICANTTTIAANNPSIGNGVWSVITGASNVISSTTNTTSVTSLSIGQNNFVWTISNGVCASSSDTITVQVDANPSAAIVGANQVICANTTTISANNPVIGTGLWSVITGASSVISSTTNSTSVTNLSVGQNNFVWTISNGVCASSSDTITVYTFAQPTTANAGADQALCALTSSSLTASSLIVGNGVWTVIAGTGTVTTNTSANTSISNLNIGQNIFVWTVSNGVCPSSSDTIIVHVDALPTIANAGYDTTIYNSLMLLNANAAVVGTGVWSVISGSGNFANSLNPSTEITGLENGQTIVQWTISNGVCPASVDELTITIKSLMVPNGFSPNGDGVNDNFEIKGLDEFTNVKLSVVNRWGSTVYENIDYKNNWNGKNLSGEDLSDDTYFFVLEIPDKKTYNGFVVLKRK